MSLIEVRSVWDSGLEAPRFMVPGMVAERCITLVYGEGKVGKGYWTLSNIIMELARDGRRVVLVALEDKHVVPERMRAYVELHEGLDTDDLDIRLVTKGSCDLLNADSMGQVQVACQGADVVVLDPLRIALGSGDEDSSKTVGEVVKSLRLLIARLSCAVVLVHHTGWGRKGYPRGSSAWLDLTDIMIRLYWKGETMVAQNTANRLAPRWKPRGYKSVDVGRRQRVIVPQEGPVPVEAPRVSAEDRDEDIYQAIVIANQNGVKSYPSELAIALQLTDNVVKKALTRLRKAGRVVSDKGQYTAVA